MLCTSKHYIHATYIKNDTIKQKILMNDDDSGDCVFIYDPSPSIVRCRSVRLAAVEDDDICAMLNDCRTTFASGSP